MLIKKRIFFLSLFFLLINIFYTNTQNASEIIIYADNIDFDNKKNIIAKGNAKIIKNNEILTSNLIIYNKNLKQIILPIEFNFKDETNNYYNGSSGKFSSDLKFANINDVKIILNDGSRIVGKTGTRNGDIDIISKGVYSPCISRIKIGNFMCPIWQLEGEKILHDNKNLFLYQKHSKMRVFNTPFFYLPYLVTPSPLRKERKSGFLTPSISLKFWDTKISQTTSFPYYFNIAEDKELTFTPLLNYGGGVNSSQRFIFDYIQLISGGSLNTSLTIDSNFEKTNNNKWLSDASLITNYNQNLNEKFKLNINSALQTSNNYIQTSDPNNELSYVSSLKTSLNLLGYNLKKFDDNVHINLSTYLVNQNNEDNKTTPRILPFIEYNSGNYKIGNANTNHKLAFYNIFRDKKTSIHSQKQQKISHTFSTNKEFIKFNTKFNFVTETHNQFFQTENKYNYDYNHSGNYYRFFPMFGLNFQTPFKFIDDKNNLIFTPKGSLVVTPGLSNSDKISNEDSSNTEFSIVNNSALNRYSGSDKLDNSKRINYGIKINNNKIELELSQNYEFTNNSNYHNSNYNLSDLLGSTKYEGQKTRTNYNFRYDFNEDFLRTQSLSVHQKSNIGNIDLSYIDTKNKSNNIISTDEETISYSFNSEKFAKFSKINFEGNYDLKENDNKEYSVSYSYFDECFGINLDFERKFYSDNDLKPQDVLTLMFSFKNVGSYKSTNLAVSETDKQDIQWESSDLNNELFN